MSITLSLNNTNTEFRNEPIQTAHLTNKNISSYTYASNLFRRFTYGTKLIDKISKNTKCIDILILIDFVKRLNLSAQNHTYNQINFPVEYLPRIEKIICSELMRDKLVRIEDKKLFDTTPIFTYMCNYYRDIGLQMSLNPDSNISVYQENIGKIFSIALNILEKEFPYVYKVYTDIEQNKWPSKSEISIIANFKI